MKCAVVLAGCGQYDGSETHEVILTLLALSQEGVDFEGLAPDINQKVVMDHYTQKTESNEERSVLKESARLVRGRIKPITQARLEDYDMIIFPGGFGAVQNLCTWAQQQEQFEFQLDVKYFINRAVKAHKPMGFICIAPMMITKIYPGAHMTIGHDAKLAAQIQAMGLVHENCTADNIVVDSKYRVVSTPANMVAKSMAEMYQGILKLVQALKAMV